MSDGKAPLQAFLDAPPIATKRRLPTTRRRAQAVVGHVNYGCTAKNQRGGRVFRPFQIFQIDMMVRPIFGGLFVSYGTWRGVFFVNVPIGVAIFVLLVAALPLVARIPECRGAW